MMQIVNKKLYKLNYKAMVLPLLCLLCFTTLKAQNGQTKELKKNYLTFELNALAFQKSIIENKYLGGSYVSSNVSFSGKSSIKYQINLHKNFYFNAGIGLTIIPFQHNGIRSDSISAELAPYTVEEERFFSSKIPWLIYTQWAITNDLSFSNKFKLSDDKYFNFELGLNTFYLRNQRHRFSGGIFVNGTDGEEFHIDVVKLTLIPTDEPNEKRFIPSYFINFGIEKKLRNKNLFGIQLYFNYVPTLLSTIEFEFFNLRYERNGTGKQYINNAGIKFNYSFLRNKKKHTFTN